MLKLENDIFMPYKQRVTGSNPVAPTTKSATYDENLSGFFLFCLQFVYIFSVRPFKSLILTLKINPRFLFIPSFIQVILN